MSVCAEAERTEVEELTEGCLMSEDRLPLFIKLPVTIIGSAWGIYLIYALGVSWVQHSSDAMGYFLLHFLSFILLTMVFGGLVALINMWMNH